MCQFLPNWLLTLRGSLGAQKAIHLQSNIKLYTKKVAIGNDRMRKKNVISVAGV